MFQGQREDVGVGVDRWQVRQCRCVCAGAVCVMLATHTHAVCALGLVGRGEKFTFDVGDFNTLF